MFDPRIVPIAEIMQRYNELTERQKDVADYLAQGLSNKGIANGLNISQRTVEIHLNAIFDHFEVRNRTAVAIMVYRAQTEGCRS